LECGGLHAAFFLYLREFITWSRIKSTVADQEKKESGVKPAALQSNESLPLSVSSV
jgi:hypothetical protein